MLASGFDDVAAFANFDDDAVADMQKTLLAAGLPPGHVHEKIMRTVRACQDKELSGSSPVKFNYNKQMPLLETLRDEVRALKEQLRAACSKASEQELIFLEEHDKWKESSELDKGTLRAKEVSVHGSNILFFGSNICPNRVLSEWLASRSTRYGKGHAQGREEAARKREEAQQAAKTAVEKAEAQCELQVSEMREQLARARLSMDVLVRNVSAAEKDVAEAEARAVAAEARATAAEEAMAEALSQGQDVPAVAERIVRWEPFNEPSSVC